VPVTLRFINFHRLGGMIDCVIDDNARKQELLMPARGCRSAGPRQSPRGQSTCACSLNPESEQKVLAKNQSFLEQGGEFLSIFASRPRAVQKAAGL
jgi:hypothetical protein